MSLTEPGSPDTAGGVDVLDRELEDLLNGELTEDGDHDRFAHYVKKDDIVKANITGKPVRALCGKKWIPNRNPDRYPVCPECKAIYERLKE